MLNLPLCPLCHREHVIANHSIFSLDNSHPYLYHIALSIRLVPLRAEGELGLRQVLRDATVYRKGRLCRRSVALEQGRIVDISSVSEPSDGVDIPMTGKLLIPGLVDVHVHLREPGFLYKESIQTGTRAAAHGGYTAVCAMPNLDPPPDDALHMRVETDAIARDAVVRVYPYGCITVGRRGRGPLCDFAALSRSAVAFSDDGTGVQDEQTMREAMRRVKAMGGLIAAHCEDEALLFGGIIHAGDYAARNGLPGISSESEWRQIERDLRLAKETGCRYHVCHVSAKESVALIRAAKREGVDVTCETAPNYLLLDDSMLRDEGRFRMNPPIRARADREALVEGLADGTVDVIATDHAPHSAAEKAGGLRHSLMGVVGLECAFAALYTGLARTGAIPLERILEAMTDAPRRRFRLPPSDIGAPRAEDFSAFDLEEEYVIDPAAFASAGRATPFAGMRVRGRCVMTAVGGNIVWKR